LNHCRSRQNENNHKDLDDFEKLVEKDFHEVKIIDFEENDEENVDDQEIMLQDVEDQEIILSDVEKVATVQQEIDVSNIENEFIQETDENFNTTNENIVTYSQRIMRDKSEILFISSFIRENTFEMIENRQIESSVDASDVLNTSNTNDVDEQNNNEFHFFLNEKDYALTL
jgi:hypothetical protein